MTERERLIELLYGIRDRRDIIDDEYIDDIADELLANGVRLPVRCGECKHSREKTKRECFVYCEDVVICTHPEVGMECELPVHGDFYCAYGERSEDNGT